MFGSVALPGPRSQRVRNLVANVLEEAWHAKRDGEAGPSFEIGRFKVWRINDTITIGKIGVFSREGAADTLVKLLTA